MEYIKKNISDMPHVNKEIIEHIPWAEEMWKILEDGLHKTYLYWCQLVLNIGESEEVLQKWATVFIETHEETLCDLVFDMENLQGKVHTKIEELLQKTQQLCKILQIQMPIIGNKQLSLWQEKLQLQKYIDEYEKLIEIRRQKLNKLQQNQLDLCNSLGKEPKILIDDPLPTAEEIENFQKHIETLEAEKFNRFEKFLTVKEELTSIINELKISPSSQFERDVFSLDESAFLVTDHNMRQLDHLQRNLNTQLNNVKDEIEQLRNKLDDCWNLLDIDLKKREEFRQIHKGNSLEVLEALRLEVKRCDEKKKAKVKIFIDKLRDELEQLWKNCHCSQAVKKEFTFFYSDCYNEDLLELHEVELKKWRKYYKENRELLTLLEKHQHLWNKMLKLEEDTSTNKNRYNNRGGQLLKEEKERKKLAKQIPQIEETLMNLAKMYQQYHGIQFTTFGVTVDDYITNIHENKENARREKLSARKQLREQTGVTPVKTALNLFPSTSQRTPLSSIKRKLTTPITGDGKKPRTVMSETKVKKTPMARRIPKITVTAATPWLKRLSGERKKRINNIRRRSSQKLKAKQDANVNESLTGGYDDFQNEVTYRVGARSTIIPAEIPTTSLAVKTTGITTPTNTLSVMPIMHESKTPTSVSSIPKRAYRTPRTPEGGNTRHIQSKSNLKLIF